MWCRITQCVRWDKTALHLWVLTFRHTCNGKYSNASQEGSSRLEGWLPGLEVETGTGSLAFQSGIIQIQYFQWLSSTGQGGATQWLKEEKKNVLTDLRRQSQIKTTSDALQAHTHTHLLSPAEIHCWTCQTKPVWVFSSTYLENE